MIIKCKNKSQVYLISINLLNLRSNSESSDVAVVYIGSEAVGIGTLSDG